MSEMIYMKRVLALLLCVTALVACGQSPGSKSNLKKQVNIPGTRLSISPPAGFKVATNFTGLQKNNYTGLQVIDLVGGNYYTNAATFSREAFEQKGVKVFDYKELVINGYPAKYMFMQGDASAKEHALVFGDTTFSVMVMAFFPVNDEELSQDIKRSMLSVTYDKNLKIDPFATAAFILDENQSRFKFAKAAANIFIYSVNGVNKDSYDDEPTLMVSTLPADAGTNPVSVADKMIAGLERNNFTDKEQAYKSGDKVNGYDAYEAITYGKMNGVKTAIYQLVVINGNRAVIINGTTKSNYDSTIQEFRKLARTIKFKA